MYSIIHTNVNNQAWKAQTYKFGGRNSHIEALERHLQAILCTSYQPQRYEELLREQVKHINRGSQIFDAYKKSQSILRRLQKVFVPVC